MQLSLVPRSRTAVLAYRFSLIRFSLVLDEKSSLLKFYVKIVVCKMLTLKCPPTFKERPTCRQCQKFTKKNFCFKIKLPCIFPFIFRRIFFMFQGPFNNYVDKMRGEGVKIVCFCPRSGWVGQKMAKFCTRSC